MNKRVNQGEQDEYLCFASTWFPRYNTDVQIKTYFSGFDPTNFGREEAALQYHTVVRLVLKWRHPQLFRALNTALTKSWTNRRPRWPCRRANFSSCNKRLLVNVTKKNVCNLHYLWVSQKEQKLEIATVAVYVDEQRDTRPWGQRRISCGRLWSTLWTRCWGHFEVRGKFVSSLNIYVQLQQLSPIHKSFWFKAKFKFKGVTQW